MAIQLLREEFSPSQAKLVESFDHGKNTYMSGIMMMAEVKNHNRRVYPFAEIKNAVNYVNQRITEGHLILGELNHPDSLTVNPKEASHVITEMRMDGNNAVGKCKLLNTPNGQIVKAILEGGVRLGVSSRGTGNVIGEGIVEGFNFVTVDIVVDPSAPNAYPDIIRESREHTKIITLAEAVCHDEAAQKYLKNEMLKFIEHLTR